MNRSELAASARRLLGGASQGVLATISVKVPGYPFGSLMPYALDAEMRPLFLISGLAVHTKNALADARASLCIVENAQAAVAARLTLVGDMTRLEDDAAAEALYLARHPEAAQWAGFGDFAFWRLETIAVYYVAGFGAMGWIEPTALTE